LREDFSDTVDWRERWVESSWKRATDEAGEWELASGNVTGSTDNLGLRTVPAPDVPEGKYYTISTRFPPFSSMGKSLVVQYVVKNEASDGSCGGMYVKLFPSSVNQRMLRDNDDYLIMFGPDICGAEKLVTHLIVRDEREGDHRKVENMPLPNLDPLSHVWTLVIGPNRTWEVHHDLELSRDGDLRVHMSETGGQFSDIGVLAFEVWQTGTNWHKTPASGSIFDSIIVTDDPAEAKAYGHEAWSGAFAAERKMHGDLLRKRFMQFHDDDDDDEEEEEEDDDDDGEEDEKPATQHPQHAAPVRRFTYGAGAGAAPSGPPAVTAGGKDSHEEL
jgi:hypothetical protein